MTEVRAEILRLGHKGDGIAEGPIYVDGALPGELVSGELDGERLAEVKIIEPSESRVKAPCSHAKSCGGCALQHASDEFVAAWKMEQVRTALQNRGIETQISKISASPPQSRRRAVFHGRRTKKDVLVGLFGRASGTIVPVPNCELMTSNIMAGFPLYEDLVRLGASRRSELTITVIDGVNGLDVSVLGGRELSLELRVDLGALAVQYSVARLSWGDEVLAQNAPPVLQFGSAQIVPPSGSFLQATLQGEEQLVSAIERAVAGSKRVVDLFAGCGTFALPLASFAEVHAVEGVAEMLQALDAGWRGAPGLKAVSVETRDLFRRPLLVDELNKFDAIVIDPPRAGAEAQVSEICKSNVAVIGFVSCNPITFARDAAFLLEAGFALDWIEVVDQFKWSTHVEVVAKFVRTT